MPERTGAAPEGSAAGSARPAGALRMADVGGKPPTLRTARAEARIRMRAETLQRLKAGDLAKGDALQAARLAGILAAKRTPELIPLCHPLPLEFVGIEFEAGGPETLLLRSEVKTTARTGVEMEALTAVSIAALTVYDMVKPIDREVVIGPIRLVFKSGGRSGTVDKALPDGPPPFT